MQDSVYIVGIVCWLKLASKSPWWWSCEHLCLRVACHDSLWQCVNWVSHKLVGTSLASLVSRLSPPNGMESLVTLGGGGSNRGLLAAGFWQYQSDCRMIYVTNLLQLQVTLQLL